MKKYILFTIGIFATLTVSAQCSGISATGTSKARVSKVCYDSVIVRSNLNTVVADTCTFTQASATNYIVPSGGTGFDVYNTVDQTTNYERLRLRVSSNVFIVGAQNGGTGTLRGLNLVGGASTLSIGTSTAVTGAFNFNRASGTAGISIVGINGSFTQTSGTSNFLSLIHTVNQSSTAGYRSLWISPYQQATGSGVKYLIDAGTNSAADGGGTHTSLFRVDNAGLTTAVKYSLSALNTAPSSAADTGTTGEIRIDASYIYICTATNTWKRVAIATW